MFSRQLRIFLSFFFFFALVFVDGSSLTSNNSCGALHPVVLPYNYYVNSQHKYLSCVGSKVWSTHYRNHLSAVLAVSVFAAVYPDSPNIRAGECPHTTGSHLLLFAPTSSLRKSGVTSSTLQWLRNEGPVTGLIYILIKWVVSRAHN